LFDGGWHLIGFSLFNNNFRFWLDGQQQTPSNILLDENILNLGANGRTYLGANEDGTDNFLVGKLDEIGYAANELTQQEWLLIYNNGIAANLDDVLNTNRFRNWFRAETDSLPNITEYTNNFAIEFDGATNYFLGSGVPDFTTDKTFSFWVKRDTPLNNDLLFSFNAGNINSNNAAKIYFDSNSANRIFFRVDSPSGDNIARFQLGSSTIGNYVHIAITYSDFLDANTYIVYLNGILVNSNQVTNAMSVAPTIANNFSIGAGLGGSNKINCKLDEYSVFNAELTQSQVQEIYNLGTANDLAKLSFSDDLAQWWRFGDKNNTEAIMEDQVGSGAVVMIGYNQSFYVASEV